LDSIAKELGVFLGALAAGLLITLFKIIKEKFLQRKKKNLSLIKNNYKNYEKIHDKLIELRQSVNADRITVYQFHNGEYYSTNNSILKVSVTHENCSESVKSYLNEMQNIQPSLFVEFFKDVFDKKENIVTIHADTLVDSSLKNLMLFRAVNTEIFCPLYNDHGDMIGFIGVVYIDKYTHTKEIENYIISYSKIISYILNLKNN